MMTTKSITFFILGGLLFLAFPWIALIFFPAGAIIGIIGFCFIIASYKEDQKFYEKNGKKNGNNQ